MCFKSGGGAHGLHFASALGLSGPRGEHVVLQGEKLHVSPPLLFAPMAKLSHSLLAHPPLSHGRLSHMVVATSIATLESPNQTGLECAIEDRQPGGQITSS